ncbi:hypothetical protein GCM10023204_48690 [Actinomycetospora succinea]
MIAPGLALAAPVAGIDDKDTCEAQDYTWIAGVCDDGESSGSTAITDGSGSGSAGGASDAASDTTTTTAPTTTTPSTSGGSTSVVPETGSVDNGSADTGSTTGGANDSNVADRAPAVAPSPVVPNAGQENADQENSDQENSDQENADQESTDATTAPTTPSAAIVENGVKPIQDVISDLLPDAGANPIKLPGLPTNIPKPDADGNFDNVNDACLNAISQLQFPTGTSGLDKLSTQLQGFCRGLDTTDVHVCLDHLRDVVKHLCPTVIEHNTTINFNTTYVSNEWWGAYWTHRYDVDCDELTYDEANAILDWDRSDPFRLDRDDDGEACEWNSDNDEVDYASYPEGGVSTGDGSTSSGASPVEIALAASAVGGLGATGLVLVRRYARQG